MNKKRPFIKRGNKTYKCTRTSGYGKIGKKKGCTSATRSWSVSDTSLKYTRQSHNKADSGKTVTNQVDHESMIATAKYLRGIFSGSDLNICISPLSGKINHSLKS